MAGGSYYVPHQAKWPIVGTIGLFVFFVGFANLLNGASIGPTVLAGGTAILVVMMFGWFGDVIRESEGGMYKKNEGMSFRMGMGWFIFSEVFFFAAFFGALFYARQLALPWLSGEGAGATTQAILYPEFSFTWPNTANGPEAIGGQFEAMGAFGLPLINTLLLLTSGVTCTIAHHAIKEGKRKSMSMWLLATVILGAIFLTLQVEEYAHAYNELNLTLESGIYGSTFFMLTGFHGFHVAMGTLMLFIVMIRGFRGHFTAENHFAFEASAWYWHFVDVVWLGLYVFVYWL
ncbi:MAG: cytochrome c oxidase subunit 3 [Gammaproteobacteria bacterium]|nr:cytochrome c oxidase subunit 3 [Gammaproteobacteria bacterium]